MSTVEDILSNPGSNIFYLNHRYYYPLGNTKAVDLTEGCEVPSNAEFLLLGCGDIRNILQTVKEVSEIKLVPKSLTFHLNDIDDVLLARNAVLIQIANTIDPDIIDDVKFLWCVWYNLNLSEQHYQRYRAVLSEILENPLELEFQSSECSNAVKTVIRYWLKTKITLDEIRSAREEFICKKMEATMKSKLTFGEAVTNLNINSGYMVVYPCKMQSGPRSEEVERYFKCNTTDAVCIGYTNTSLLCPHVDGWRVHPSSLPFDAYNDLLFDETSSLTDNCFQQLREQIKSWKMFRGGRGKVKVVVWYGDALTLCHRRMPLAMKFDYINSSNLCDHITFLDVLLACSKRLKRSGILTTQTMHLLKTKYRSMDKYLESQTGIPPGFYPTFLGLRLAEDFELGTSKVPKGLGGFNEVTVRWLSVGDCSPCISLEDSNEITQIFERIANSCFETCMLRDVQWYNTPLTLVFLMKELSTKLTSGVMPLLKIAERNLPKKYTPYGLEFNPLEIEWKVLTLYHFGAELNLKDDTLIAVKVPILLELSKLPFHPPAGFDSVYRAVITEDLHNMMLLAKGNAVMPWSSLSVVDFDYKTGVMTCILPKSDVDMFESQTLIWVFQQSGGMSPLLPKGTVNINGPMLSFNHSWHQAKIQNAKGEDSPDIKLVMMETEHAYRIKILPKHRERKLEGFTIETDPGELKLVHIRYSTRDENGTESSQVSFRLPCQMTPMESKRYIHSETVDLEKSRKALKGPMILRHRRIDISSHPLFPSTKQEDIFAISASMFTSTEDQKNKVYRTEREDALFKVKESIQIFLNWSVQPPKEKPLIRGYRLLREFGVKRPTEFQFGYLPDDIFIGIKNLHRVNGVPTLDIVWMDFEIFRKQVPYEYAISEEEEMFMLEHGGSTRTPDTWHCFFISPEESVILKTLLRLNTQRSLQTLKSYGSPVWCFKSFIQPLYTVTLAQDRQGIIDKLSTPGGFEELSTLAKIDIEGYLKHEYESACKMPACSYCGKKSGDLKKCQRCKSVLYCGTACQKNDWKSKHRNVCLMLPPSNDEGKSKVHNKEMKIRRNTVDKMAPKTEDLGIKEILNDGQDCLLTADQQPLTSNTIVHQDVPGTTCTSSETNLMTSQWMPGQLVQTRNKNVSAQKCGYCDKTGENMQKCSRCKLIFYCCKMCQKLDWKLAHKNICRPVT